MEENTEEIKSEKKNPFSFTTRVSTKRNSGSSKGKLKLYLIYFIIYDNCVSKKPNYNTKF